MAKTFKETVGSPTGGSPLIRKPLRRSSSSSFSLGKRHKDSSPMSSQGDEAKTASSSRGLRKSHFRVKGPSAAAKLAKGQRAAADQRAYVLSPPAKNATCKTNKQKLIVKVRPSFRAVQRGSSIARSRKRKGKSGTSAELSTHTAQLSQASTNLVWTDDDLEISFSSTGEPTQPKRRRGNEVAASLKQGAAKPLDKVDASKAALGKPQEQERTKSPVTVGQAVVDYSVAANTHTVEPPVKIATTKKARKKGRGKKRAKVTRNIEDFFASPDKEPASTNPAVTPPFKRAAFSIVATTSTPQPTDHDDEPAGLAVTPVDQADGCRTNAPVLETETMASGKSRSRLPFVSPAAGGAKSGGSVVEDLDENPRCDLGLTAPAWAANSDVSMVEDLDEDPSCDLGVVSREADLAHTTMSDNIDESTTGKTSATCGEKPAACSARKPGCMVECLDLTPGESFILAMQERELSLEDADNINERKVAARPRSERLTGRAAVATGQGNTGSNAQSIASLLRTIEELQSIGSASATTKLKLSCMVDEASSRAKDVLNVQVINYTPKLL